MFRVRLIFALLLLFALAACGGSAGPSPGKEVSKVKPMPINAKAYGKSYGEWTEAFSERVYSIPWSEHPMNGGSWETWQSGKVWFLSGGPGGYAEEYDVTIPPGKALCVNLLNISPDNVGVDPPMTIEQLWDMADYWLDSVTDMSANLDGYSLADDLFAYRSYSPGAFSIEVPENDNIYQVWGLQVPSDYWPSTTITPMVAGSYALILPPLSAGVHVLSFTLETDFGWWLDVTFNLTVQH